MSYEPFEKEWLHAVSECERLGKQRTQLREALERAADDLAMIARVEKNYLAGSGAERCRAALKATEEG